MEDRLPEDREEALIHALRTDPGALERLYRLYAGGLYRYALALTGDAEAAKDAVQETMIAAWQGSCTFDGRSRALTWLVGICRNKVVDILRRKGRTQATGALAAKAAHGQADAAHETGVRLDFWDALGRLPYEQREVLLLVFHYGLSQEEASAVLEIPKGTVRSRVYRARKNLQALLERGKAGTKRPPGPGHASAGRPAPTGSDSRGGGAGGI